MAGEYPVCTVVPAQSRQQAESFPTDRVQMQKLQHPQHLLTCQEIHS
jgi:hypothetical protein